MEYYNEKKKQMDVQLSLVLSKSWETKSHLRLWSSY